MTPTSRYPGLGAAVVLTVAYAVVGLLVLEPEFLVSIDGAIKLLQAQALIDSGFSSLAIPYRAATLDPDHLYVPFAPPFVFVQHEQLQGVYPVAVAILNAFALLADPRGIVLLSLLSAFVTLVATGRLTRRKDANWVVFILGACTPFWAYSMVVWEHMPALACSTLCWVFLERRRPTLNIAAGILLGTATVLRHESALLFPCFFWLYFTSASWRAQARFLLAAAVPVLSVGVLDAMVFDRAPFAHLAHAIGFVWKVVGSDAGIDRPTSLSLAQQAELVLRSWIFGLPTGLAVGMVTVSMLLYRVTGIEARRVIVVSVLVGAAVLAARDVVVFGLEPEFVAGIVRIAPFLWLAVLPPGARDYSPQRRRETQALLIFLLGLFSTARDGGAQIGPRFLIPILPLAAKLALEGWRSYGWSETRQPFDRVVRALGVILVVGSLAMQFVVTLPAFAHLVSQQSQITRSLLERKPSVVVMLDMYLINLVAPVYQTTQVVMPIGDAEMEGLFRRLSIAERGLIGVVFPNNRDFPIPTGFEMESELKKDFTTIRFLKTSDSLHEGK